MQTAKIKTITRREWDKDGKHYEKWVIQFEGNEQYFDSFCGKWNSEWRVGTEVTVEDDQWQKPKDPKYNTTIKAPASARGGFVDLKPLEDRISGLASRIGDLEAFTGIDRKEHLKEGEPEIPIYDEEQ